MTQEMQIDDGGRNRNDNPRKSGYMHRRPTRLLPEADWTLAGILVVKKFAHFGCWLV